MTRILLSVDIYLSEQNLDFDISIDLISIINSEIEFFENITI